MRRGRTQLRERQERPEMTFYTFLKLYDKISHMFRTLPSLNGLRAFEAVARLGSFSAAADELHVTYGAVSRLVKSLEGQLETVLLTRSRQGAAMTGPGAQLHSRLRPALELMRVGVDEISAG